MKDIDVTIIASRPNNGHFTMLFTDEGMIIKSECTKQDAYNGLCRALAEFLLDSVDEVTGDVDVKTLEDEEKIANCVAKAHHVFTQDLGEQLATLSAARQLKKNGMPDEIAIEFAKAIGMFPGKWSKADLDKDSTEE